MSIESFQIILVILDIARRVYDEEMMQRVIKISSINIEYDGTNNH